MHHAGGHAHANGSDHDTHATVCGYLALGRSRWLKPLELAAVLGHAQATQYRWTTPHDTTSGLHPQVLPLLSSAPPQRPRPGSIYLFSKQKVTRWRKDQYQWQGGDRHTNLKLHGVDLLVCNYAKCSESSAQNGGSGETHLGTAGSFQRRGYSLLAESDIVLVHYLGGRVKGALKQELASGADAMAASTPVKEHASNGVAGAIDITQYISHFLPSPSSWPPPAAATPSRSPPPSFLINGSLQLHPQTQTSLGDLNYEAHVQQQRSLPTIAPSVPTSVLSHLLLPTASGIAASTTTAPFHHATNPYSPGHQQQRQSPIQTPTSGRSAQAVHAAVGSPPSTLHELLGIHAPRGADQSTTTPFHLQHQSPQARMVQTEHTVVSIPPLLLQQQQFQFQQQSLQSPAHSQQPLPPLSVLEYSPNCDYIDACSKLLVCLASSPHQALSSAPLYCHLIRVSPHGLQIDMGTIALERVCGETYRAILPSVPAPGECSFYVSDSPGPPSQATRLSQLLPFTFRARPTAPTTPTQILPAANTPTASTTRSRPPIIRTRSRDLHVVRRMSRSPSPSSFSRPIMPANAAGAPPATTQDGTSHEREFIAALLQRLRQLEQAVTAARIKHRARSSSSPSSAAGTTAFLRTTSCGGATLNPSPLLSLLTPNPLTPTHNGLSPLSQHSQLPFHRQPPPDESLASPSNLAAAPSSLTFRDLESCILDAPGEDLIESLLLCMLKKIMETDSTYLVANGGGGPSSPSASPTSPSSVLLTASAARDGHGRQLIHLVAGLGYTHLLALLIAHLGAHVDAQDDAGRTPLHHATLVDAGLDGDEADGGAGDASSPAAMMVSALLSYGANDSVVDFRGFTPLALADAAGRRAVVSVFLEVQNAESMGQDHDNNTRPQQRARLDSHGRRTGGTHHHAVSEEEDDDMATDDEEDEDETMFTPTSVSASSAAGTNPAISVSPPAASSTSAAISSATSSAALPFPLDRAFSSLTLHDMGINAADFLLPSSDGSCGSGFHTGSGTGGVMSASDLFASPTPHFSRVVSAIQRQIRWWLFRRHMAAGKLQSVARGMLARRSIKRMREASLTIQSKFRQRKVRRDFVKLQNATRIIQENFQRKRARSDRHQPDSGVGGGSTVDASSGLGALNGVGADNESDSNLSRMLVVDNPTFRFTPDPDSQRLAALGGLHDPSGQERGSILSPDPLAQLLHAEPTEVDYLFDPLRDQVDMLTE